MDTLYYEMILREHEKTWNKGFVIILTEGGRIKDLVGVFTCDYIKTKIKDDSIEFIYYALTEKPLYGGGSCYRGLERFRFSMSVEDVKIPLNFKTILDDGTIVEFTTVKELCGVQAQKCKKKLNHFQEGNVV